MTELSRHPSLQTAVLRNYFWTICHLRDVSLETIRDKGKISEEMLSCDLAIITRYIQPKATLFLLGHPPYSAPSDLWLVEGTLRQSPSDPNSWSRVCIPASHWVWAGHVTCTSIQHWDGMSLPWPSHVRRQLPPCQQILSFAAVMKQVSRLGRPSGPQPNNWE